MTSESIAVNKIPPNANTEKRSDASSNDSRLSEPKPESLPTGLQKKNTDSIAFDKTCLVEVDASTNTVNVPGPIFGTKDKDLTRALVEQVANVTLNSAGKHGVENLKYALAAIHGIAPKDELEDLLAVQMIGVHSLAMEYLKRASQGGPTTDGVEDINVNRAAKFLHIFTELMDARSRHRGKVGQQIVVRDVNVSKGGQAIVGRVSHDGRGKASTEDDADKVK